MSLVKRSLGRVASPLLNWAGRRFIRRYPRQASGETSAYLNHTITVGGHSISFYCPNDLTLWRAETLLTKEPETIAWIDTIKKGDVLWDIGANVGIYSLYAAIVRQAQVIAFEPSAFNYFLLCKNVELNSIDERVSPLCVALSDKTMLEKLNMQNTEPGGALSGFATFKDYRSEDFTPAFRQASLGFSIDDFVRRFNPPFPNHIKIDVDGIEEQIVRGAKITLSDERLHSVSIELEEDKVDQVELVSKAFARRGLSLKRKKHAPMFDNTPYANAYNYLFVRQ